MSAVDSAWQRMKDQARECAVEGRTVRRFQAEAIVTRLMHECGVSPAPNRETISFFARELLQMIEEYQPLDEAAGS